LKALILLDSYKICKRYTSNIVYLLMAHSFLGLHHDINFQFFCIKRETKNQKSCCRPISILF